MAVALEFRLLLGSADSSVYRQPVSLKVRAETMQQAAEKVARKYGYEVDSVESSMRESSEIWFTNPRDGTNLQYLVDVYEIKEDRPTE